MNLIIIISFIAVYFFFCFFSKTLILFLNKNKTIFFDKASNFRDIHLDNHEKMVTIPKKKFNEKNSKLEPERYYYNVSFGTSIILIVFNSYIISQFLSQLDAFNYAIITFPFRFNLANVLAMVIVIVEIISGFFYYIGYEKQEQEQDETIWAFLKFGSLFAFCSFILIELVMWAQVSTAFNILESLGMSNDNFFSNYINYFLMALGIGIGLIEFFLGVITSKYRSSKGDSSLISSSRFLIVTIGLIILIYIPSVFLVFLGGVFAILVFLIQTLTLLGDYIIEKLSFKKNN